MKPGYGPTLGVLLSPRWRAASRATRVALTAAGVGLLALLLGAGLTLENSHYSRGGSLPFSFEYRELYRAAPEPGQLVRVSSRWEGGRLKYSYAVSLMRLPPYTIEPGAEVALFASSFARQLARTVPGFEFRGEGKTKISNTLTGYEMAYYASAEGERLFVRDVVLLPAGAHPREGVVVWMQSAATADSAVHSPLEVGETGVLLRPLKTFSFG